MRGKTNPEQLIHKAIVNYLKMFPSKLIAITVKNTGTVRNGIWCPSSTTIKGVSDLIVFPQISVVNNVFYSDWIPFFAEIKTDKGKQSKDQKEFQKTVEALGYDYYIWRSINDAQKTLKWRGLI